MTTLRKSLLGTAAGLTLFACISAPASAGQQGPLAANCWGTKLETRVLKDHVTNKRIGRVELWFSADNRGTNCVITYNEVAGKAQTYAWLIVDDNRNRDNGTYVEPGDRVAYDDGNYEYYAGASYWGNTNTKCVRWGGSVNSNQGHDSFGSGWSHCG